MAQNVLRVDWTIFWVTFGTAIAFAWLLASVLYARHRRRTAPVAKTREEELPQAPTEVPARGPVGYLRVFNRDVQEGNGGLTVLGWVVLVGIPVWWALYLIVYWGRDLTPLPTDLLPF